MSFLRDQYRHRDLPFDDVDLPASDEPDQTQVLDRLLILDALGLLPPMEREVVVLHYLEDLSIEQMATMLDIPPGTVKSRLHRSRRHLRDVLEGTSR